MINKIEWWNTEFDHNEINAVAEAIKNRNISQGRITEQLEKELAGRLEVPYVVCTTNGSMALLMACMVLGIKSGDEVIVPNRTFIATAHAALILGAKIVIVDTRTDIPVIDVSQIQEKITSKTKAIIPSHLNGRPSDMKEINKIVKENNLNIIEDAAQALFSKNFEGYLGTQSDIGCFSLGMTKLISTGQGGFVVTKNKDLYEKLKLIRNHGVSDTMKDSYNQIGFNFKFNDILASIGLKQLSRVQEHINHVNKIYDKYKKEIKNLPFLKLIPVKTQQGEVPLWIEVLCSDREKLIGFLKKNDIETRQFLPNLNLSPHLYNTGDFPNSKVFDKQGMFLPCGPSQPLKNIDMVIEVLKEYK